MQLLRRIHKNNIQDLAQKKGRKDGKEKMKEEKREGGKKEGEKGRTVSYVDFKFF